MSLVDEPSTPVCTVAVRALCEFVARQGDLDLRFTPAPTALQGQEGHALVARRRGPGHEAEVSLSGDFRGLHVRGRADGYDAGRNELEEVKTFRGRVEAIAWNHQALHWAQLKVYGWLMCQARGLTSITLTLVYFDVMAQTEHPFSESFDALTLQSFFESLCGRYLHWAQGEARHRHQRDAALESLDFPQKPFRPGQRDMAAGVYRACVQSRPLLVQAPTGIGKTLGTVYPALRAMPVRGTDKLFFLTAKTPGRRVALEALQRVRATRHGFPLRVLELVARDKACEHKDKACHGQSCPLAQGFYDRLPAAREAAAQAQWLDQAALRDIARAHQVCPYYLGHDMARWADVVVGDYNYYFDRSAMLYALTAESAWRVSVLVDEAHNLYSRACAMYSADLSQAEALEARSLVPASIRPRVDELLNQWQLLLEARRRAAPDSAWQVLDELPEAWVRTLQRFNSAVGEYLNDHPTDAHGALLPLYFRTLSFAGLAAELGDHSLCELDISTSRPSLAAAAPSPQLALGDPLFDPASTDPGMLTLRNIVPAPFLAPRLKAADAMILFSATLNPSDYYIDLLGLPDGTQRLDIPSVFRAEQLEVRVVPLSTRRDDRAASLDTLVQALGEQARRAPGNYMAFFSSFDYMEMVLRAVQARWPELPVWSQARQMDEESRQRWLQRFDTDGHGVGFAVLGGVFSEGVDLPGRRLVGAFIATLGLPQFDDINRTISERMQARFGRGHDYTYVFPGLQKVVQAAGRVIRTETDTGTVLLMDERYLERRYRVLLPDWWRVRPAGPPGSAQ
ncbi:MAG: ATP-dependent DNA helicase [Ramlibacter sp.]|nr:ATP-dependent DNA helicase [Ramlibacter sp.]